MRAWLERGAKLGARVLCLSMPPLQAAICTSGVSGHQDHDDVDGAVFARYQDALNVTHALLHELRFDAEAFGVPLVVEVAHGGCFLSPVELRDLIDRTNSWAIGACVDVDRVFRVGSPIDWIETLGRRVHCARVAVACDLSDPQFPRCSLSTVQDALRNGGSASPIIVAGDDDPVSIWSRVAAELSRLTSVGLWTRCGQVVSPQRAVVEYSRGGRYETLFHSDEARLVCRRGCDVGKRSRRNLVLAVVQVASGWRVVS